MRQWSSLWLLGLILALFGVAIAAQRPPEVRPSIKICTDEQNENRIREIMLKGLDAALQDRVMNLFEVWMKDETGQPERARSGIERGISAYIYARNSIAKWTRQPC